MFPSPQSALPLPSSPDIDRYRKIAKELVKACKSGEEETIRAWATEWIEDIVRLSKLNITPGLPLDVPESINGLVKFARRALQASSPNGDNCNLSRAQFVIARSHGFESWPKFASHLRALRDSSAESRFELAADAIVNGDIETLEQLLRDDPGLVRARSARNHGASLLHYVSANGVEGYRQKTPKNIVRIARILLDKGASVDATANVYGHASTTLELAATSRHPERAGVQEALLRTLIERGAALNDGIVSLCLANGRLKAAQFLAVNGAPLGLAAAAGVGNLDAVQTFIAEAGSLVSTNGTNGAARDERQQAFFYACQYGHDGIVLFLLEQGAEVSAADANGQTGLHWAVIGGHLATVNLLLRHKAPLNAINGYGGTVREQALWSAAHSEEPDIYIGILETLIDAGT